MDINVSCGFRVIFELKSRSAEYIIMKFWGQVPPISLSALWVWHSGCLERGCWNVSSPEPFWGAWAARVAAVSWQCARDGPSLGLLHFMWG